MLYMIVTGTDVVEIETDMAQGHVCDGLYRKWDVLHRSHTEWSQIESFDIVHMMKHATVVFKMER